MLSGYFCNERNTSCPMCAASICQHCVVNYCDCNDLMAFKLLFFVLGIEIQLALQ